MVLGKGMVVVGGGVGRRNGDGGDGSGSVRNGGVRNSDGGGVRRNGG